MDKRKTFTYRDVTVIPQVGARRYFGCRHGHYLTRWWRVFLGPMSWVLTGSKIEAKKYIDKFVVKTIYILVGPQGSGKTYWAQNTLPTHVDINDITRISQDEQGRQGHKSLFKDYVRDGKSTIVVDRMNFSRSQRNRYISFATQYGYRIIVVWFQASRDTCLLRLATRQDHPTISIDADHDSILNVYFDQFEPPSPDEYDELQKVT